ncbi:cytochrome c oxidase assembly protein [Aureimonas sp. AU40]|uniref:cytochrome c oxidase assembly protein n=1 Tax=Aureimonas sp. AU40 TaxID=1637747 RepID=UPI000785647C|nr:cytochrome c oxidase assembly protein [Aureimonas sp. AU40]
MRDGDQAARQRLRRFRITAFSCLAFACGMIGAAYASVPLYDLFCKVTGYGGTTQRAEMGASRVLDQTVKVRFDSNAVPSVPWTFQPNEREVTVRLGETRQISYRVRNASDRELTARATFNVTPLLAGAYFNKIQCFCFTDQTLKPGEEVDMPVVFFVDPAILDDADVGTLPTITLSYTFFPAEPKKTPVADATKDDQARGRL